MPQEAWAWSYHSFITGLFSLAFGLCSFGFCSSFFLDFQPLESNVRSELKSNYTIWFFFFAKQLSMLFIIRNECIKVVVSLGQRCREIQSKMKKESPSNINAWIWRWMLSIFQTNLQHHLPPKTSIMGPGGGSSKLGSSLTSRHQVHKVVVFFFEPQPKG